MGRSQLVAVVEKLSDGGLSVIAPAVGVWCDPPRPGSWLGPGSSLGEVERLSRRSRLLLPDGVSGVVLGRHRARRIAVEHGEELFRLAPLEAGGATETVVSQTRPDLPAGARAVVAPTDGVFYRRPSPDAPSFVEPGSRLERGQPVGLIEVMKTFNQILYDGDDLPDAGEVLEVRCEDASEVRAGQVLIVIR